MLAFFYLFHAVSIDDDQAGLNLYCLCADPLQVNWLMDGCETQEHGGKRTECHCNHLTYFSILVVR